MMPLNLERPMALRGYPSKDRPYDHENESENAPFFPHS